MVGDTIEELIFLPKKQFDFMERCIEGIKNKDNSNGSNLCSNSNKDIEEGVKTQISNNKKEGKKEGQTSSTGEKEKSSTDPPSPIPYVNKSANVCKEKKMFKKEINSDHLFNDSLVDFIGRPYKRAFLSFMRIVERNRQLARKLCKLDNLEDILKNAFSKKRKIIRNEKRFYLIVTNSDPSAPFLFANTRKLEMYQPQFKKYWKI